jgi:hypothetical protein
MITGSGRHPRGLPGSALQGLVVLVAGADVMDLGTVTADRVLDGRFHGPRPRARARTSRLHLTRTPWETPRPFSRPFTGQLMGHSLANSGLPGSAPRRAGLSAGQGRCGRVAWGALLAICGHPSNLIHTSKRRPHPTAEPPWRHRGLTNARNGCHRRKLVDCRLRACATTGRGPAEDRQNVSRTQTRPLAYSASPDAEPRAYRVRRGRAGRSRVVDGPPRTVVMIMVRERGAVPRQTQTARRRGAAGSAYGGSNGGPTGIHLRVATPTCRVPAVLPQVSGL